jgi:hypothetical protein
VGTFIMPVMDDKGVEGETGGAAASVGERKRRCGA